MCGNPQCPGDAPALILNAMGRAQCCFTLDSEAMLDNPLTLASERLMPVSCHQV